MLVAFEEILYTRQFDQYWREAIKIYIEDHIDYFCSKEFKKELSAYYDPLQKLISEVVAEYKSKQADGTGERG
jgi:hypothetical protein